MSSHHRVSVLCACLAFAACASADKQDLDAVSSARVVPTLPREGIPEPAEAPRTASNAADPAGKDQDVPDLEGEDFEQGFCMDDIYARYLLRHAPESTQEEAKLAGRRPRSRRARRQKARAMAAVRDLAAFSYARDKMNGRVPSYFGAIPIVSNKQVDFWVQYYKTVGRQQFMRWLIRGESVRPMVQPVLAEHGIPDEFFYLAMIESGFSNNAKSHARATGTWQFMQATARLYGLKIDHWVDERRDPVKSSIAAAAYLRDLYADLGDWHLAMAAYNAGPGKIRQAIKRSGKKDFWELAETNYLAEETRQYVPKVLAAIMLAKDAKRQGFEVQPNPADALPEAEVLVKYPVRIEELATKLGIPTRSLIAWNPELIREITPPLKTGYAMRLPPNYAMAWPEVEKQLTAIQVTDVQMHVIRQGDTLSRIARRYKIAVRQILALNPGLASTSLKLGRAIAIPVPGIVVKKRPVEQAQAEVR